MNNHNVSNRFAYLIIAHNEPYILHKLVALLDDSRNDIFLIIDKKSDKKQFREDIRTTHSRLIWCEPIDIRWGDISQVKAELQLFETAYTYGCYKYFHLISGVDLPIKSQDYIHDYFNSPTFSGKEFIHYVDSPGNNRDLKLKTEFYHFFTRWFRPKSIILKGILIGVNKTSFILQKIMGIKRYYRMDLKKGMNWCSLSLSGVQFLLNNKDLLLKTFKYTWCPDEIFIQSLFWTKFNRAKIYRDPIRLIDWNRGKPYTFKEQDYEELKDSPMLFARKFSTSTKENKRIVDIIFQELIKYQSHER